MTKEQLNYLWEKELRAIRNHKDNIDRIKKEYFDSVYGLKKGDKVSVFFTNVRKSLLLVSLRACKS